MQIPSVTNTNLVINPSFELVNSNGFGSLRTINVSESVKVNEFRSVETPGTTDPFLYDLVNVGETTSVALQNAINKPNILDTVTTVETITIDLDLANSIPGWTAVGGTLSQTQADFVYGVSSGQFISTGPTQYMTQSGISGVGSTAYQAQAYVKGSTGAIIKLEIALDSVSPRSISVTDSVRTTEQGTPKAVNSTGPAILEVVPVSDTVSVLLTNAINKPQVTDSVSVSETITINLPFSTASQTLTGGWDLISLPSFTTGATNGTFDLRIYPTTSQTFKVDGVIVQGVLGAYPGYFDGSFGTGFAWTGLPNLSTSTYTVFVALANSNSQSPQFGALIDWTKTLTLSAGFFTINVSAIGGADFIPGTQVYPTFFNQYLFTNYVDYLLNVSIQKSTGQFPYGIFASQMTMVLDNTSLIFMPGFDPVIGNYILNGRPIQFTIGYGGEFINWFAGTTIKPSNDLQSRTLTLVAFDGSDYLNNFVSQGAGPLASQLGGTYYQGTTFATTGAPLILPQAYINVTSTTGFPSSGTAYVYTEDAGLQLVSYTGITPTSLTGCSGGTGTINLHFTTTGVQDVITSAPVTADQIIGDLLSEAGFATTQYVADMSLQLPIGYLSPKDQTIGGIIQQICEAEQAYFFFDENGVAHFWNNQHISRQQTPVWAFDYSQIVNFTLEDTPIINDVVVKAQPRSNQSRQLVYQLPSATEIPGNTTTTVFADFSDDFGSLPITSIVQPVYIVTAPFGSTSTYSTNFSDQGVKTDPSDGSQTYITVASVSLVGTSYLISFTNTNNQSVFITSMDLYGTPARVTQVINREYLDPTSIALYGTNPSNNGLPLEISNDLIQSSDTAYSDAYTLVNDYSQPYQRMIVEVFAVPQLQFGDAVTVYIDDLGLTGLYTIVGISNGLSNDGEITQTLTLNTLNQVHYFTINQSAIGGIDAIAP